MKPFKFFITCVLLFAVSPAWATWQDVTFNSNATVQDGDQYVRVFANNNADVAILGGQIGSLFCDDTSKATISSGTFRCPTQKLI